MTIICIKNGIVAADSALFDGDSNILDKSTQKVFRLTAGQYAGDVAAYAGMIWWGQAALRWLQDEGPFPGLTGDDDDSYSLIVVGHKANPRMEPTPNTNVTIFTSTSEQPSRISSLATAKGPSASYALGAMGAGCSAVEAVHLCIENTTHAAGVPQYLRTSGNHKTPVIWTPPE